MSRAKPSTAEFNMSSKQPLAPKTDGNADAKFDKGFTKPQQKDTVEVEAMYLVNLMKSAKSAEEGVKHVEDFMTIHDDQTLGGQTVVRRALVLFCADESALYTQMKEAIETFMRIDQQRMWHQIATTLLAKLAAADEKRGAEKVARTAEHKARTAEHKARTAELESKEAKAEAAVNLRAKKQLEEEINIYKEAQEKVMKLRASSSLAQ